MICNIDYVDPTNDQFILKQVPLKNQQHGNNSNIVNWGTKFPTNEPIRLTENSVIKMMLNDFSLSLKLETFCNHDTKNNYIYFIILFILFILFYNSI